MLLWRTFHSKYFIHTVEILYLCYMYFFVQILTKLRMPMEIDCRNKSINALIFEYRNHIVHFSDFHTLTSAMYFCHRNFSLIRYLVLVFTLILNYPSVVVEDQLGIIFFNGLLLHLTSQSYSCICLSLHQFIFCTLNISFI